MFIPFFISKSKKQLHFQHLVLSLPNHLLQLVHTVTLLTISTSSLPFLLVIHLFLTSLKLSIALLRKQVMLFVLLTLPSLSFPQILLVLALEPLENLTHLLYLFLIVPFSPGRSSLLLFLVSPMLVLIDQPKIPKFALIVKVSMVDVRMHLKRSGLRLN